MTTHWLNQLIKVFSNIPSINTSLLTKVYCTYSLYFSELTFLIHTRLQQDMFLSSIRWNKMSQNINNTQCVIPSKFKLQKFPNCSPVKDRAQVHFSRRNKKLRRRCKYLHSHC